MKALIYLGPGDKALEERPKPTLQAPGDAIVRLIKTTICGTDLHILKGDVPTCAPGRILGHEGVGVIETVGAAVTAFKAGDHVLISCISACGKCEYCRRGMYSHCTTGGWILGNTIDGTQAELAPSASSRTIMPRLAIAGRPGHLPPTGVRKYLTSGSQNELVTTRPDSLPDYVETLKALLVAERVAVRQRRPSTLADWVGRGAWWLRPLHARLLDELRASPKLFADETAAPVLVNRRPKLTPYHTCRT